MMRLVRATLAAAGFWLVLVGSSVAAETLTGNYITGRLVGFTGYAVANGTVKLIDSDGVMLNVTNTDNFGKFKLELDTLEEDDLEGLSQSYLHFSSSNNKKTTKVKIGGWAVQEKGYITFPTVSLK